MKILRLETEKGSGIYMSCYIPRSDRRPGPYNDGIARVDDGYFGFLDFEFLLNWFSPEELWAVDNENPNKIGISEYDIPEELIIDIGNSGQLVFRRSWNYHKCWIPLSELIS